MTARAAFTRVALAALATTTLACAAAVPAAPTAPTAPPNPPRAAAVAPARQPRLEDYIQPPGSTQRLEPFMLHADQWIGTDQRAVLDTIVYALENGARCCRILNADSLWAVDYTWIWPHSVFPPRWYDARALFAAAESLHVSDDAEVVFTFGTLRMGVGAKTFEQARAEAIRRWPAQMPRSLAGRLELKLDRARKALAPPADR